MAAHAATVILLLLPTRGYFTGFRSALSYDMIRVLRNSFRRRLCCCTEIRLGYKAGEGQTLKQGLG